MAFAIYDGPKAVQDLWRPTTGANSQIIVAETTFVFIFICFVMILQIIC